MKSPGPAWISPRSAGLVLIIIAFGAAIACVALKQSRPQETTSPTLSENANQELSQPAAPMDGEGDLTPVVVESGQLTKASGPAGVFQSAKRESPPAAAAPARPEPSPQSRQLVTSLSRLDLTQGLTAEQSALWKENLRQLVGLGAEAVPAIREFMELNQDFNFASINGGDALGYSSVRTALLEALQSIGGPEALELSLQILQGTAVPAEIAILARNLEAQAPGQYGRIAVEAARDTLAQAAGGKVAGEDVGALFEVMQRFGDASVAGDLEKAASQWNYYAATALANLPDGAGVPALIAMVQNPDSASRGAHGVALQVLAQLAGPHPEAGAALVDLARRNQIPPRLWPSLAASLTGEQFQLGTGLLDGTPPRTGTGVKTMHVAFGNQNFYSTSQLATWSTEQITQRMALLDQLMSVNAGSAQALQQARALLAGRLNQ